MNTQWSRPFDTKTVDAMIAKMGKKKKVNTMKVQNVFQATYLKVKGFKIGKVQWNEETRLVDIEIEGDEDSIKSCINEYEFGGQVDCRKFTDELGYIKYLVKKNVPNR